MNIDELYIGDASTTLNIHSSEQHREASIRLIEQAKRFIRIHSFDLEAKIYDNRKIVSALRSFIISNHRNKVEILIHDSKNLRLYGHQLIEMARQFSSFVEIRKIAANVEILSQGFIIADDTAIVQQHEMRRYEGIANFNNRRLCKKISDNFIHAWLQSSPDPELRQLII